MPRTVHAFLNSVSYPMISKLPRRTLLLFTLLVAACSPKNEGSQKGNVPVVGFVQAFEDATIDEARTGYYAALREAGFSEDSGTVRIIYRNSQGDGAALNQVLDYMVSQKVDAVAANTTLAMITAANKTHTIPIFMMVAPSPQIAKLTTTDASGKEIVPANLFGAYETLDYIDTSIAMIKQVLPNAHRVGTIFNSSEPNSVNAMERLRARCSGLGLELTELSVTSSNESQQVMASLLDKGIDVFFALPDNIIFASFETIHKQALDRKIPIVTSEAGLVKRGAFIAYGADFYQWGHQAGVTTAAYLKTHDLKDARLELVTVRKRTYNATTAAKLGLPAPSGFEVIK